MTRHGAETNKGLLGAYRPMQTETL
jgi:hypothetical protein